MSKFIKRIGTTASKFMVEFFKGDHVMETKNTVPLEKGVAKFEEKLVIPATLYFDKKKSCYNTKEAKITVNVVTPKVTRLAGISKLELSQFPNKNVTEQEVVQNVDKCFDKNSKIYFKVRMIKVSDILSDRKSHRKTETDPKKRSQTASDGEANSKERSESPLPSMIQADMTNMQDFSDNSSISELAKFDGFRSQIDRGKSPEFRMDDSSDGEDIVNKARSKTADVADFGRAKLANKKIEKEKFIEPALSELTTISEPVDHPRRYQELEVKVRNYQRENKELYDKIKEDNEEYLNLNQDFEDLKLKYDRLKKEHENILNSNNIERSETIEKKMKVYQDKINKLEREIQELTQEKNEANERSDDLQQTVQDLLSKIESLKNIDKKHVKNDSENLEQYIAKINELTNKLKESEKKMKDLAEANQIESDNNKLKIGDMERENKTLKTLLIEKNTKIDDLEKQLVIQANEMDFMKKMNSTKKQDENNQQVLPQIENMEKRQKALEETYKKRIEELTKQNTELKKELERAKTNLNSSQFDTEHELGKISIENETLKRQLKEANAKLLNVKYDNKEVEEMKRRLTKLEADKEKLDAELVKAKVGWASADIERDEAKNKLKLKEESTKGFHEKMEAMESEVVRLRSRIADVINIVMEFGESDILDKIEALIT